MARITMGIGTSHGPLLTLKPEDWDVRTDADRVHPGHPYQGGTYKFDDLLALRRNDYLIDQNTLENRRAAFDRCQAQLDALSEVLLEEDPDVIVVFGDDHKEWFLDDVLPAIAVFNGDFFTNRAADPHIVGTTDHLAYMREARAGTTDIDFPCAPEFATHMIQSLIEAEFDVASSSKIPMSADGAPKTMGHAFSFIYRRLLRDKPIPLVPIAINTYYPPNQPSPHRCFEFGRAVSRAVEAWGEDKKVCVIASGGLSHFAIDEEFDKRVLDAMLRKDSKALTAEPDNLFQSGSSETKNWIAAAGAISDGGLDMDLLDYVPCYRSEAGTGNAMAFAVWR